MSICKFQVLLILSFSYKAAFNMSDRMPMALVTRYRNLHRMMSNGYLTWSPGIEWKSRSTTLMVLSWDWYML
jgi:hypothetical protein